MCKDPHTRCIFTYVTARNITGICQADSHMPASKLITHVDLVVAGTTKGGLIGGAEHNSGGALTGITKGSHNSLSLSFLQSPDNKGLIHVTVQTKNPILLLFFSEKSRDI
uniref:B-box zinc finger protein 19-like n=1 Tax=Rhizophora mucronata TaxID=61149 RepID=A0A2P2LLZ2_RHIMU